MTNNDYISRRAVINVACSDCYCCETIDEFEDTTCPVKQKFMSIPAADVEPKRKPGRWVGMQEYCQHLFDTTGERYTMSQLGIYLPHCNQCWEGNESRTAFCPHCGAKMFSEPPKEERKEADNGDKL